MTHPPKARLEFAPGEVAEYAGPTRVAGPGPGLIFSEHVRIEAVHAPGEVVGRFQVLGANEVSVSDGAGNVYLVFRSVLCPPRGHCICDVCDRP